MGFATDRVKEKDITIPEGWEVVEHKEVDNKLLKEYEIYNWRDRKFCTFVYCVDKGEVDVETMEYTSGMIAIRKILIVKEPVITVKTKPIKRMSKSSFLKIVREFIGEHNG